MTKQKNKLKQTEIGKIPEDWEVKKIGEICNKITDGSHFSPKEDNTGEYQIATVKDFSEQGFNFKNCKKISKKDFEDLFRNNCVPKEGNVLISKDGTMGIVYVSKGENIALLSSIAIIIPNKDINSNFLGYYLKERKTQHMLKSNHASGSALPRIVLKDLKEVKVIVPPVLEQKAIAKILSDLDAKIELNTKMNNALESFSMNLFKKKIIDLEKIPKGWETKPLDKIADFLNGLALQKYPVKGKEFLPVIKIRELKQGITANTDKAGVNIPMNYIVGDGDILFSWSGSLEVVIWGQGKGALNQHLFKVSSEDYPKWFYYYWTKYHLPEFKHIAAGKATTMGHIKRHHLEDTECIVPDKETLENMNKIFEPIIERQIKNLVEIRKLSKIRDILLPKLMGGEIRVPIEVN